MNFNMRKNIGAHIVTEYDGLPVLVIDTSVEEGLKFLAMYGGAGVMAIDGEVALFNGDTPYIGYAIGVADRVVDELPIPALCAVLEHESQHARRGDKGYADMTKAQMAEMEIDCDAAGIAKYGARAMATGIATLSILAGAARGLSARGAMEELDAVFPGRWEALIKASGKKMTVADMIGQISAMFDTPK
jgi:hypothetical protein